MKNLLYGGAIVGGAFALGFGLNYLLTPNVTNFSGQDMITHQNILPTLTTIDSSFILTENKPITHSKQFYYSVIEGKFETAPFENNQKEIFADDILLQYKELVESMKLEENPKITVENLLKLNKKIIKDFENKIDCKELDILKNLNKTMHASDFLDTLEEELSEINEYGSYDLLKEIFNKFMSKLDLASQKALKKMNVCVTPVYRYEKPLQLF